ATLFPYTTLFRSGSAEGLRPSAKKTYKTLEIKEKTYRGGMGSPRWAAFSESPSRVPGRRLAARLMSFDGMAVFFPRRLEVLVAAAVESGAPMARGVWIASMASSAVPKMPRTVLQPVSKRAAEIKISPTRMRPSPYSTEPVRPVPAIGKGGLARGIAGGGMRAGCRLPLARWEEFPYQGARAEDRTAAARRIAGGGKSGLHGSTAPGNTRPGRPEGQCHRDRTAGRPGAFPTAGKGEKVR